jgi:hypothetical protein
VHDLGTSTGLLRVECAFYWALPGFALLLPFFERNEVQTGSNKVDTVSSDVMHFGGNCDNMATADKREAGMRKIWKKHTCQIDSIGRLVLKITGTVPFPVPISPRMKASVEAKRFFSQSI